jgi:hypothetical protein
MMREVAAQEGVAVVLLSHDVELKNRRASGVLSGHDAAIFQEKRPDRGGMPISTATKPFTSAMLTWWSAGALAMHADAQRAERGQSG